MTPCRHLSLAAMAVATLTTSVNAGAQSDITERQQKYLEHSMDMLTPMSGQTNRIAMEVQLEVLSKPETAQKLAAFAHNYYQALVKTGFTEDQALQIVARAGIPLVPPAGP